MIKQGFHVQAVIVFGQRQRAGAGAGKRQAFMVDQKHNVIAANGFFECATHDDLGEHATDVGFFAKDRSIACNADFAVVSLTDFDWNAATDFFVRHSHHRLFGRLYHITPHLHHPLFETPMGRSRLGSKDRQRYPLQAYFR